LEVSEGEDRSLVFALRRHWLWPSWWTLDDAEGSQVGTLSAGRRRPPHFDRSTSTILPVLPDRGLGQLREQPAETVPAVDGGYSLDGQMLSAGGKELARLQYGPTRTMLQYSQALEGDPFTRMLVLAAALLWRR
jgi:hypothetical protein